MRIAFYKAKYGNWFDKLIAWWTRPCFWKIFTPAAYSHVEISFSDGISFGSSPRDGGCRWKNINYAPERWDFIEVPIDEAKIKTRCNEVEGKKYDWVCIFLESFIPLEIEDPNRYICSELVAKLVFRLHRAYEYNPQSLFNTVNYMVRTELVRFL